MLVLVDAISFRAIYIPGDGEEMSGLVNGHREPMGGGRLLGKDGGVFKGSVTTSSCPPFSVSDEYWIVREC